MLFVSKHLIPYYISICWLSDAHRR